MKPAKENNMKKKTPIEYVGGPFTEETTRNMDMLRNVFGGAYELVFDLCPNGRAKALALTKIEEACQWAIKSVVFKGVEIEKGSV